MVVYMLSKVLQLTVVSRDLSQGEEKVTVFTSWEIFKMTTIFTQNENFFHPEPFWPPVDLYLISEKSIWKNQVRQTGFLVYIFQTGFLLPV